MASPITPSPFSLQQLALLQTLAGKPQTPSPSQTPPQGASASSSTTTSTVPPPGRGRLLDIVV